MLRKSVLTLACTFALAGSVWADTPIGLGTTGTGGTGANEADGSIRNGEGGAGPKRQDGMPLDQADKNVRANSGAAASTRDGRPGNASTGATSGASSRGSVTGMRAKPEETTRP